jgi:hypothetical protein
MGNFFKKIKDTVNLTVLYILIALMVVAGIIELFLILKHKI